MSQTDKIQTLKKNKKIKKGLKLVYILCRCMYIVAHHNKWQKALVNNRIRDPSGILIHLPLKLKAILKWWILIADRLILLHGTIQLFSKSQLILHNHHMLKKTQQSSKFQNVHSSCIYPIPLQLKGHVDFLCPVFEISYGELIYPDIDSDDKNACYSHTKEL